MRILLFSHTSIRRRSILLIVVTALLLITSVGCSSSSMTKTGSSRRQLLRHAQYHVTTHHQYTDKAHHISGLQIIDDDVNTILAETTTRELMRMGAMSMSMSMSIHLDERNHADNEMSPTESPRVVVEVSPTTTGRYDDNNNEPTADSSSSTGSDVGNNAPTPTTANENDDGYNSDLLDQIIDDVDSKDGDNKKQYDPEIIPVAGPKPYFFFILVAAVICIAICLYCV